MQDLDNDRYMKELGVDKWKGDDPAWKHITVIDRKHKNLDNIKDPVEMRKEIENLILEKG